MESQPVRRSLQSGDSRIAQFIRQQTIFLTGLSQYFSIQHEGSEYKTDQAVAQTQHICVFRITTEQFELHASQNVVK